MHTRPRPVIFIITVLTALTWAAGPARAQAPPDRAIEGVVVQVQGGEIIVDLGRARGLPGQTLVQVYRRVEVKHPITHKTVVDRFPIGAMLLEQVGSALSIASRQDGLSRKPEVGDFVVFEPVASPRPNPTPEPEPSPGPTEPPKPPDTAALETAFARSLGRPLTDRITIFEAWLVEFPASAHAPSVGSELQWLREKLATERGAIATLPTDLDLESFVSLPSVIDTEQPLTVVAAITRPDRVEAVRVLVRRQDQVQFQSLFMERAGDTTWRTSLPPAWRTPGTLDVVVEAVRTDGKLQPLEGLPERPRRIEVIEAIHDPAPVIARSRARLVVDVVDFKTGPIEDDYVRFESDFRYRVDYGPLSAVSVGVGLFNGRGGALDALNAGTPSRAQEVNYGFAEAEVELHPYLVLSGRMLVGNLGADDRSTLGRATGFRTQLRIGGEGTNLELGTALTDGIGNEGWITFNLDAIERVPMEASVVVTNLPVGEDLGVSLNVGAGWAFTEWFALLGRLGWNARTINDFGPTVGLATTLTW